MVNEALDNANKAAGATDYSQVADKVTPGVSTTTSSTVVEAAPNDPLWMPEGSVRSVLALTLTLPVMVRYAVTGVDPSGEMLLLVSGVAAAYGLSRVVQGAFRA